MKNVSERDFSFRRDTGTADDFIFWMKKCKNKSLKKQVKILNKRKENLGTFYMLSFMSYSDSKLFNLIVTRSILKEYIINSDSEFSIRYEIEQLIEAGVYSRITFILACFPLIEKSIIKYGIKLIESGSA